LKVVDFGKVRLYDLEPVVESFFEQVVAGLSQRSKTIPCKFFYDAKGADIFGEITRLSEYYPTRLETQIMEDMAGVMARTLGERVRLVEFGSGSSVKTRLLLTALTQPASYVPIDISREYLVENAIRVRSGDSRLYRNSDLANIPCTPLVPSTSCVIRKSRATEHST